MHERRAYRRYSCSLPLYVQAESGDEYALKTAEISLGGLRVECDGLVMRALLPVGLQLTPGERVLFQARLCLKAALTQTELRVSLHAVGVTRLAENTYALHFAFVDLSADQIKQLEQFIQHIGH